MNIQRNLSPHRLTWGRIYPGMRPRNYTQKQTLSISRKLTAVAVLKRTFGGLS